MRFEDEDQEAASVAQDIREHHGDAPATLSAHVRSVLTQSDLTIPIADGRLALGTWQGIYLWEHRTHGHRRRVMVTVQG
jgi:secondary thiamine-phosphate synthase enzyme